MLSGLSLIKILSGLSRTIGVARAIIPIVSGIKPVVSKGIDLINKSNSVNKNVIYSNNVQNNNPTSTHIGPTFFH